MLDPYSRRHVIETLRPPQGYRLDFAVGTTFSLDLVALLTAPLAFTFFDWEADGDHGRPTVDPLALLEALRRHADRIAIFCEAGQITVPSTSQRLFSYLEGSVYETAAPRGGSFHPKVWVLRFTDSGGAPRYRLICLSRNLTFDRSWDTVLVLDSIAPVVGQTQDTTPISTFLRELPGMVVRGEVPERVRTQMALIQREFQQVQFELPLGFDQIAFHPIGVTGAGSWPFNAGYDRLLVVSPFVTAGCLTRLSHIARDSQLVARLEELQSLEPQVLGSFSTISTLSPSAAPEDAVEDAGAEPHSESLVGLHAKLYVADDGDRGRIWTGSANATDAAFARNVEFLVELVGARHRCGVAAVLGESREVGLHTLLESFVPATGSEETDAVQETLDQLMDQIRRQIARLPLRAHVLAGNTSDRYSIEVRLPASTSLALAPQVSATCWPVTIPALADTAVTVTTEIIARFPDLSFEALTSFFAFRATARLQGRTAQIAFVVNIPLIGAPENRRERMLRALLADRAQVLRFLLLLLADDGTELSALVQAVRRPGDANDTLSVDSSLLGLPLLEAMIRTLDRDPGKLDHVARLIADLRTTPEGQQLLPPEFEAIWAPIRAARESLTP